MKVGIVGRKEPRLEKMMSLIEESDENIRVFIFPSTEKAVTAAREFELDLLLICADESCKSIKNIPGQCKAFFLAGNACEKNSNSDLRTVTSYGTAAEWHKFFEGIKTGTSSTYQGGLSSGSNACTRICMFTAARGGQGVSSAALAFGAYLTERGKRVLYIDANAITSSDYYLIQLKKQYPKYEIDSIDITGFPERLICLDGEAIMRACEEKVADGQLDVIIIDLLFDSSMNAVIPFINAEKVVFVSDGSRFSNMKLRSLFSASTFVFGVSQKQFLEKALLLYNNFGEDGEVFSQNDIGIGRIGGIESMKSGLTEGEIIFNMVKNNSRVFRKLADELNV